MTDTTTKTTAETVPAWLGDPAVKADAVARMRAHREADSFVQGLYAKVDADAAREYRGCFHGCLTTEALAAEAGVPVVDFVRDQIDVTNYHREAERLFGIPRPLGRLLDVTFESIPADSAGLWAVAVTEAIPVGADLSLVTAWVMLDLLADEERGVWRHTKPDSRQRAAVETVAALYRRKLAGGEISDEEWRTARSAAYAAYAAAAYAAYAAAAYAAYAAAAYAAYAAAAYAAYAAYAAAAYAAYAAYAAAADGAARQQHYVWLGERLIHHISSAPQTV